ncbi:MAG: MACPF domain-containing protein [Fibromonadales bacterium]|nr:MACPF domain-containing protein [Fibromonadales bacterium]
MKINRFSPLVFLAISLIFFACSDEATQPEDNPTGNENSKSETFLGYGYDVIHSSFINRRDVKISHPILDQGRMSKDGMIATEPAVEQDFKMYAGNNLEQFYKDRNAGINVSYSGILFSGKFGFEFSNAMNESKIDSSSYVRGHTYRYTQDDYIKGATPEKLADYLTEDFANALKTKNASQILDQYGTHVLARYYKGGSLEFNYTYTGKSLSSTNQLKTALQASYAGISGGVTYNSTTESRELEEKSLFHYYTYGGESIDAFSLQELKASYSAWLNSIENKADICGIGDFNQSLIPLWELARAGGYSTKASELEAEFSARAIKAGKALLVKKLKEISTRISKDSTYSFNASKDSPAEIEIYALGAGGGGQGGSYEADLIFDDFGRGGSGGGGAAAYIKLTVEEAVLFNITVGKGGEGGAKYSGSIGNQAGYPGKDGGNTEVKWTAKGITLSAGGGKFGGASGTQTPGGAGGVASINPPQNPPLYSTAQTLKATGANGQNGCFANSCTNGNNTGGSAARLPSPHDFGGGSGAIYPNTPAVSGGGGSGGHCNKNSCTASQKGGDGQVLIKLKYYSEE